ncbi:hypothetical protein V5F90_03375 [Priestia aryabhattai]|jgi:ATP/maltotriose-dependent transcriptional regulator MalT
MFGKSNIKQKGSYQSKSDYVSGETVLSRSQYDLFKNVSEVLLDDYDSFLNQYIPESLIRLLHHQAEAKLGYGTIGPSRYEKAFHLIEELKTEII